MDLDRKHVLPLLHVSSDALLHPEAEKVPAKIRQNGETCLSGRLKEIIIRLFYPKTTSGGQIANTK